MELVQKAWADRMPVMLQRIWKIPYPVTLAEGGPAGASVASLRVYTRAGPSFLFTTEQYHCHGTSEEKQVS